MAGVELVAPDGPDDRPHGARPGSAAELAAAVRRECLRRGLIVDVVRLLPPLIVTEEQMSAVLERLADAVQAVDRHPGDHAGLREESPPSSPRCGPTTRWPSDARTANGSSTP